MAVNDPYTYKVLFLTKEESDNGQCLGYKFAYENRDRWVDMDNNSELTTYDRGTSGIVYGNKFYNIYRDYVLLETKERVFICKTCDAKVDMIDE